MTQRLITHLRHVDLAVPDFGKQLDFFTHTWGLTAEHSDSGLAFLAAEGSPEQYVVRLRQADDKRIDLISFGAASPADVDTLAAQVAADGVQLISEPGTLQTPGGGYGFRFFDNEGRTVEISADVAVRQHRAIEEGESIPVRLSHVVINSADPEGTRAFYEKHLAFALSDTLMHPRMGNMMWFMRINAWHHSLAIARGPHPSLHHASFEMRGEGVDVRGVRGAEGDQVDPLVVRLPEPDDVLLRRPLGGEEGQAGVVVLGLQAPGARVEVELGPVVRHRQVDVPEVGDQALGHGVVLGLMRAGW